MSLSIDSFSYPMEVTRSLAVCVWEEYQKEITMYFVFMLGFLGCRLLASKRLPVRKAAALHAKLAEDDEGCSPPAAQCGHHDGAPKAAGRQRFRPAPLVVPPPGASLSPRTKREPPHECPPGPPADGERPPPPACAPPAPPVGVVDAPQTAAHYSALIRAAGRAGDAPEALRLLGDLERQLPGSADTNAWNCALEACVAGGSHEAARQLLVRIVRGGRADVVSYNTYLKVALTKDDGGKEVGMLLEEMRRSGHGPNTATYNSMIKDAITRMEMPRAWQITHDMEQADIKPDAITCSVLLRGAKHSDSPEDMDHLFEFVQGADLPPDQALLGSLLDVGSKIRDPDRLAGLLDVLRPSSLVQSVRCQGALIRAYGQALSIKGAWAVWRDFSATCAGGPEGLAAGCSVSAAMVESCLACGDLEGAADVFREVQTYLPEFPPGPAAFGLFVRTCLRKQQPQLAIDLYEELKEELECDLAAYAALVEALVRRRRMEEAAGLLRDMARKGVSPDAGIFCLLIRGHCSRGHLEEALQLLGQARRFGLRPDLALHEAVLEACARKQMRALTEQVWHDMRRTGVSPSSAGLLTMVRLYGSCGDLDAAFAVVDEFSENHGGEPRELGPRVFECLLAACITGGDLGRALSVRDRMVAAGHPEDPRTHQALAHLCERRGAPGMTQARISTGDAPEPEPLPAAVYVDLSSLKYKRPAAARRAAEEQD